MLVARKEADGYTVKFEEEAKPHTDFEGIVLYHNAHFGYETMWLGFGLSPNEALCNLINYGKHNRDVMSLDFE